MLLDAGMLGLVALLLRIPALLAFRHHDFNDGTYGASAIAMRHGGVPFREVFSSQGPAHLPLVWLFDLPRTAWSPRLWPVVAGVALPIVVYAIARRLASRPAALVAGALIATSGSLLWTAGPITSDAPTALFVALAFLAGLWYDDAPSRARAAAVAAPIALAVATKPAIGIVGCLPAAWLLLRRRRRGDIGLALGVAVVIGLAFVLPFGAADVWDQAVRYQLDSEREASMWANALKVTSTLWDREPIILAALISVAVVALVRRGRPAGEAGRLGAADGRLARVVVAWCGLVLLFLVWQPALWRQHLAALVTPLALLVACRLVELRWVLVAIAVAIPLQISHQWDILDPPPYDVPTSEAVDALRALPDDAQVISDEVGIVWRAGYRTPDDFADTSIKQLQQGRITSDRVAEAAARPEVCAVLVWRSTHFGSFPDLPAALEAEGYEATIRFEGASGARVLYTRADCPA
jgi:4-amino-4-deoxy-L-arabinose transferase-like glycosyltransferase